MSAACRCCAASASRPSSTRRWRRLSGGQRRLCSGHHPRAHPPAARADPRRAHPWPRSRQPPQPCGAAWRVSAPSTASPHRWCPPICSTRPPADRHRVAFLRGGRCLAGGRAFPPSWSLRSARTCSPCSGDGDATSARTAFPARLASPSAMAAASASPIPASRWLELDAATLLALVPRGQSCCAVRPSTTILPLAEPAAGSRPDAARHPGHHRARPACAPCASAARLLSALVQAADLGWW